MPATSLRQNRTQPTGIRLMHESDWMQRHGLPRPDRYVHVRGDMLEAEIPPGIRQAERSGSFAGPWED